MKTLILVASMFLSASAMAFTCDALVTKQDIDSEFAESIVGKFEEKGYRISRVSDFDIIAQEGRFTHITINVLENSDKDIKAGFIMRSLIIQSRHITDGMNMSMEFSKKTLFGSAKKSLLKSIEASIPDCYSK